MLFLTLADWVSYANIASGVGSLVSVAGIYYAYRALSEVRLQREATYKPELVIGGGNFNVYNYPLKGPRPIAIPWEYTLEDKGTNYNATDSRITPLALNIHNIGLGTAKNVTVTVESDVKEWRNILDMMSESLEGELPFHFVDSSFVMMDFQTADYVGLGTRSIYQPVDLHINHILPLSVDNKAHQFDLPTYIFYFYSAYVYIQYYSQKFPYKSHKNTPKFLPPINILISYFDIANKKIEKHFQAVLTRTSISVSLGFGSIGHITVSEIV